MRNMDTEQHLEPARSIIARVGGVAQVAEITGRNVTRVYRWMYPRERGGTGGTIPHAEACKLLDHARKNEIDLSPADFFGLGSPEPVEAAE